MSLIRNTNINKSELGFDAWGRNKFIEDYSIYHGVFTTTIPSTMWVKYIDGVEDDTKSDTAFFYSNNGKGSIKGAVGQSSYLMSRRHPRYQPNRGHLYSSSVFCPQPTATGTRRWGIFNSQYGAFFELVDGVLSAVIRTTVDGITTDDKQTINYPVTLEFGNIYDIQMQWRGVGDIKFFIGNPETGVSDVVSTFNYLNARTELSIANPALPIGFESVGDVVLECGCCDVSSEGGKQAFRFYQSIDSTELSLTSTETPMIAFRIPPEVNGLMNTRDCALTRISAYANDNAFVRIYYSRDPASVVVPTWNDKEQGFQQYALNDDITSFDISLMNLLSSRRIPANNNVEIDNPDKNAGDLYMIHDDIILVTVEAKNNTLGGVIFEYSEEV